MCLPLWLCKMRWADAACPTRVAGFPCCWTVFPVRSTTLEEEGQFVLAHDHWSEGFGRLLDMGKETQLFLFQGFNKGFPCLETNPFVKQVLQTII